jgi:NAD(P)-dependent dehydrogenase (short-subunit alcohol dehydrogenase family)
MPDLSEQTPAVRKAEGAVVVTGGAKRLGRDIALGLAGAGYAVAVHYGGSADAAKQTVSDLTALGVRAAAFKADLADEHEVARLMALVADELDEPFALVNSASAFEFDDATSVGYHSLEALMRTNLAAPLVLSRTLHERLKARDRQGVVVNLLDQKLFNPNPDFLSYTLTKAALHFATTMLAQALAPTLRVVGIAPGITLPSGGQSEEEFEKAHRMTPLGRSSRPEDIVEAVLYLLKAKAITGSTLIVDGGQHLVATPRDVMFHTQQT